ncbi:MAG: cytochrome c3 family protein [Desulfococcaceae bacterium]|jgi:hypothetical protein|nr:cytochrome c3 family protein [Desulfococcaceae bacterium]
MDKKTLGLLVTEALLIVVLVVVIAMDFNKAPLEEHAASPDAAAEAALEEKAVAHEETAEEKAAEVKAEAKHEEAAEEVAEEAAEEAAEVKVAAKEEKPAEVKEEVKAEAPAAAAGGGAVADVIAMQASVYDKHTKGIVQFTHKKHAEDYKLTCGDCHHDDSGAPLADLKMGDEVIGCAECHSKVGKPEKDASAEEKREFHKEALHDNCIDCHKDYNKKNNTKDAPTSCGKCHPKTK